MAQKNLHSKAFFGTSNNACHDPNMDYRQRLCPDIDVSKKYLHLENRLADTRQIFLIALFEQVSIP